jgi:cysteine synthase
MGEEILADIPAPAAIVGSLGSGGTMYGTARFLKERGSKALVVTTEAASGTKLPGIGGFDDGDYITPFIAKGRADKLFDVAQKITHADAVRQARALLDQGFFVGLQTGGVVQAAIQTARSRGLSGDIAVISGDAGWKNMDPLTKVFVDNASA